jgi:hypothetical protein
MSRITRAFDTATTQNNISFSVHVLLEHATPLLCKPGGAAKLIVRAYWLGSDMKLLIPGAMNNVHGHGTRARAVRARNTRSFTQLH